MAVSRELTEVARVFLRLGTTAFGGPAAHVAAMEDEIVTRRQWLSREEFADLLGAAHLIPGPNSTELAIHVGYHRAGWAGLLVAVALIGALLGVSEVVLLLGAIVVALLWARFTAPRSPGDSRLAVDPTMLLAAPGLVVAPVVGAALGATGVFVSRLNVLTEGQLLDAIAIGQVTPGPVFSAATFVGYLLAGHAGAAAATVGIFLPAFVAVAVTAPLVRQLRASPIASRALDAVNAVSLALMLSVVILMARGLALTAPSLAILVVASALLLRTSVGAGWVLLGGALAGLFHLL